MPHSAFESLLSREKKTSTIQRHRGARSLFASCDTQKDIRQQCVIYRFSRVTPDKHVPSKNFGCRGTVHLRDQKKDRDLHLSMTEADLFSLPECLHDNNIISVDLRSPQLLETGIAPRTQKMVLCVRRKQSNMLVCAF